MLFQNLVVNRRHTHQGTQAALLSLAHAEQTHHFGRVRVVWQVQVGFVDACGFLRHIAHIHHQAQQVTLGVLPNGHAQVQANAVVKNLDLRFAVSVNRQASQHQEAPAVFQFIAVRLELLRPVSDRKVFLAKVRKRQPLGLDVGQGRVKGRQHGRAQVVQPRCVARPVRALPDGRSGNGLFHDQNHGNSFGVFDSKNTA